MKTILALAIFISLGAGAVFAEDTTQTNIQTGHRNSAAKETPRDLIQRKLDTIILKKIIFEDVIISDALAFLQEQSCKLDTKDGTGVNLVLKVDKTDSSFDKKTISLSLTNASLSEVLDIIHRTTGLEILIDSYAVFILPPGALENTFEVETFTVPSGMFLFKTAADAPVNMVGIFPPSIHMPEGVLAYYFPKKSQLFVRAPRKTLDEIAKFLEEAVTEY